MSKNTPVKALSENTRKAIIITAIVVVAVIIISVALALILRPSALSPDDQNSSSSGSSSLTIRNGDFAYTTSEEADFPKTAQNWTRYGYEKASGSTHGFATISSSEDALMGIVNLSKDGDDNWETVRNDLTDKGVEVPYPGLHAGIEDGDDDNNNVYMIATRQRTAVSILSDSASVSSGASVKITIWLNTKYLGEDTDAVVMIQKSTVSAKSENWYAYDFHVNKDSYEADENGWQRLEFYVFNRDASTKYVRVSIGIGNVYSGEKVEGGANFSDYASEPIKGEGILFIDDITYETVTANEYREQVDAPDAKTSTMFKIIENEDIVEKSTYFTLEAQNEFTAKEYKTSEEYVQDFDYSPFTKRDDFEPNGETSGFKIYQLSHEGEKTSKEISMRLSSGDIEGSHDGINVKSSLLLKDHHHISFWVRVEQGNKAAYANVYVQRWNGTDWEDINDSSKWTIITTSQDLKTDNKCGWVKYDVYLKPSAVEEAISILFVLGSKDGYTTEAQNQGIIPNGSMFVTTPAYEKISYTDYNSASSGSYVKKIDLVGTSASTTVSNGSFSTLDSTGRQPSSWSPAFGGDNAIYRDGRGDLGGLTADQKLASTIAGSGVEQNYQFPVIADDGKTVLDDEQKNVLKISNTVATSFGYYSTDINLSSKTAYVISVMFRKTTDAQKPYIYLLNASNTDAERKDRLIAEITGAQSKNINAQLLGYDYNELGNNWVRYYMVVVTADESMSVRLALFNGSIDGSETQQGDVFYDKVEMRTLGTYSLVEDEEDEEATEYKVEWTSHKYITPTKESIELYGKDFGELLEKGVLTEWNITVEQPSEAKWTEMKTIPDKEENNDDDDHDHEAETEPREVDWGLLLSVVSSVALVAALLVVFVVRLYKNKKGNSSKAA